MIIEKKEYINILTPAKNGCQYVMIEDEQGDIYIDIGCDLRPNLQTGASRYVFDLIMVNNKPIKLNISQKLKTILLSITPCDKCGGTRFKRTNI